MTPRPLGSLLIFLPLTLAAQSLQEPTIPLNNWAAPLHLKRSQLRARQRVVTPKSQLPGSAANDSLVFVPLAPCRLADTRPGQGHPALGATPLAVFTPRTLPVAGSCGVESTGFLFPGPEAFSLNVTVVPPGGTAGGYLLVYPNPTTPIPLVASLTWNPAASYQTGAVVAAASADGSVNVAANSTTDVVIDINGYYAAPTDPNLDTALGAGALPADSSGTGNTAFGYIALNGNSLGLQNSAFGAGALESNIAGSYNVAVGYEALEYATGNENVAVGDGALQFATGSGSNVAVGLNALGAGGGGNSVAIGAGALEGSTGTDNIAVGSDAGSEIFTGSYDIMIGSIGDEADNFTTRIGSEGTQTSAYIAGILGYAPSSASPVVIDSHGRLGTAAPSSRRFKDDIQDMGDASKGLLKLRPVTFRYKKPEADGSKPLEYGLIAEQVADVYPELVIRGADGQIESVQYQKLPAMLLNELQKEHRNAEEQAHRIQRQDETIQKLEARLAALEAQLAGMTAKATSGKASPATSDGR